MVEKMKKLKCLAVLLVGLIPTFAFAKAKVEPLQFTGVTSHDVNQARWDSLMKYKIWGTDSINIFQNVKIPDSIGYNGTKGRLYLLNNGHVLGGPTLVGGNMDFDNSDHDSILAGPVRVQGNVRLGTQNENLMEGTWCVQGGISSQYNNGDYQWNALLQGPLYTNETSTVFTKKAGNYGACPQKVPPLEDLSVPELSDNNWQGAGDFEMTQTIAQTEYIHVPPDSVETNNYGTYDKYYNNFVVNGTLGKVLYVLMPPGGKLTRIFSKNGFEISNAVNNFKIQVVYVKEGTKFANGKWDLTDKAEFTYVSNSDYSGNLLFYTKKRIAWDYWDGASFQGTWMTTDSIVVGGHFKLAGQIVARYIHFLADIKGDFQYMPFDPPWIDINPEARTWGTLYEGVSGAQTLNIRLNEAPTTDVTFKYCYIFTGDQANNRDTDPTGAHAFASLDDVVASGLPICNGANSTNFKTVTIPKGSLVPTSPVGVEVQDELVEEWDEMFTIRVFDMVGAVLPNKMREGEFLIEIVDDDKAPLSKDTTFVGIEDEDNAFVRFPALTGNGQPLTDFFVKIESLPTAGKLIYNGNVVDAATIAAGLVIPSSDIGKLVYRGEPNAFGTGVASFTFRIINKDVPAVSNNVVAINLNAVNDGPTAFDTTFTINENVSAGTAAKGKIRIADVDDTGFIYAFDANDANYAKVVSKFNIDAKTGKITVKSGATLDYEALVGDTTLKINVLVSDSAVTTNGAGRVMDTALVTIKVLDVNEAPKITYAGPFSVDENSKANTVVGQVLAEDPDIRNPHFGTLSYSIDENSNSSSADDVPFTIQPDGTILVATGANLDFETKPVWVIHVTVTDGTYPQHAEVTININDLNEPPHIDDILNQYVVAEHSPNNWPVTSPAIKISDPDAGDGQSTLTAKIEGYTADDVMAESLFVATVAEDAADHSLKIMITVKDSAKLDYEKLLANGSDTILYDIRLILIDRGGATGSKADTAFTTIYVKDINEKPTAKDANFSIPENSPANTSVGQVVASDPDTAHDFYGTLYYSIIETASPFKINNQGKITVAAGADLDYETTPNHKITIHVKVTDKEYSDTATVVVTLTDVNEPPVIIDDDSTQYNVPENTAVNKEIARYEIKDVDAADANFLTSLVVSLTDDNSHSILAQSLFNIDVKKISSKTYAVLSVKSSPDFEAVMNTNADSLFNVTITLKDQGGASGCNVVTLKKKIIVRDVNEAPIAQDGEFSVKENSAKGTSVGKVQADDEDLWKKLYFSLLNIPGEGNVASLFNIDNTGKITVAENANLDYETKNEYKVKVVVKDNGPEHGFQSLSDTAVVIIHVTDEDEKPGFDNKNPTFYVYENSKKGTNVGTVKATDDDCKDSTCAALTYELIAATGSANANDYKEFKINSSTGKITVAKDSTLDYETDNLYYVRVVVYDGPKGAAGTLTDTAFVTINIKDANDKPIIDNKTITVPENSKAGTVIDSVPARDQDEWAELTYRLDDVDPNDAVADLFTIDANGVIRVARDSSLDYETRNEYKVLAIVTDNGSLKGFANLSDTAVVTIKIGDENEPPEFIDDDKTSYKVAENAAVRKEIARYEIRDVDAADADLANSLVVTLKDKKTQHTIKAESLFSFTVEEKDGKTYAVIRVGKSPDYEEIRNKNQDTVFTVTLTLKDQKGVEGCNSVTLQKKIYVRDVNEKPKVEDAVFAVDENSKKGVFVGDVEASDPDEFHANFGTLYYSLLDSTVGASRKFDIDSTGRITVAENANLNYEDTAVYYLKVRVTDNALSDTALVTINLNNVEENPKIIIDDDDDGDDDSDTLCVAYCDTTGRGHNGDSTLTVKVNENSATGTIVVAYTVSDEDIGQVSQLTASLKDNWDTDAESLFKAEVKKIDGTWKLVVSVKNGRLLDYESIDSLHQVTIFVTDPSNKQDSLVRNIKVIDVNEKPDVKDAVFTVNENSKKGDSVGVVDASDPDKYSLLFGTLHYSLLDSSVGAASKFDIDDTGRITVAANASLNYEDTSVYYVKVRVADNELSDTALVTIKLKDVDEKPKIITDDDDDGDDDSEDDSLCVAHCDTTNRGSGDDDHGKNALTVGVDENVPTGTVVLQYYVSDEDAGDLKKLQPSLQQISASVEGSAAEDLFDINMVQDGNRYKIVVTVKDSSLMDYEELRKAENRTDPDPEYTVRIIVSEPEGYGDELKDTIIRVIRVQDVNEAPLFDVWPCEIAENNQIGDSLGRIEHPTDIDSLSKTVSFYNNIMELVDGDTALFELDTTRGPLNYILTAKVKFDCEERDPVADTLIYKCGIDGAYHVVVDYYAIDNPTIKMRKDVPVKLIDVNEKPKILTDTVEVKENVEKGTVIDTVKATDPDLYDTVLTYTLVEDESGCFKVSKSGVITVKKDNCPALDYEKNKELPIKVKVTDNGTDGSGEGTLSDTKTIIVKITDVNEAPDIPDQEFTVPEDTKPGKKVAVVEASDPDVEEEYSTLTFSLVEESEEFDVKEDGTVILKKPLDYEKDSVYEIKVRVTDGELSDTAIVTMKVGNIYEQPKVEITRAETVDSSWTNPDTLYINTNSICIEWVAMERKSEKTLLDSSECGIELDEGENFIIRKFEDPTMDEPGCDTLVVYVNTQTPIVTVRKATDELADPNIFTVVEQNLKGDTAFYVNDPSNDIIVTIEDPAEKTKEKFTVKLDLDTVKVPSKTYKTVSEIADHGIALNDKPSSNVTHTPVNGEKIAVTYTDKVNGKNVLITYYTDSKGELIENADGVVEMTVTYTETINGIDVKISYQADAVTGSLIKTTGGYAKSEESSEGGKNGKNGKSSKDSEKKVVYTVSYDYVDASGNIMKISYGVDAEGNIVRNEFGSIGYELTYTYMNKYGNASTQSIFVVLDEVAPEVKILYPTEGEIIYANYVDVKWTVDIGDGKGPVVQDTLVTQSLNKGGNGIVRFYRDKAGNIASDTVRVIMKNAKDVDIAVEQPVTLVTQEKVDDYYAVNEPEEGETFAVSIYNPKTDKEVETQVGGEFDPKEGSGDEPYPGLEGHLGPTLGIDTKVPAVNAVGGLATLDDLVNAEGLVALQEVDGGKKITVDEYVEEYCSDEFAESVGSDLSRVNLYKTKMRVKIWIYTTLGEFVDYYSFTQDLDNPDYASDAGLLTLYFEMKPDRDGNVRTAEGRLMATGAYIYKTEVELNTTLRCSLPPFEKKADKTFAPKKKDNLKGSTRKVTEEMLKSFGYKRPEKK